MSSVQRLAVSPKLPTILADQSHLELPGYDIFFYHLNTLHVVPINVDVSRFKDALSRALQLYPHAAGNLRYIDHRWVIELTNAAIPLDIEYKLDSSIDSFLDSDWVIQDDLSAFIDTQPIGANVFNDNTSLLCVKLTFFGNETCIGVTWQHSLGDGITLFRFLHTLSQFYQGLSPKFATPSFMKYHFPTPSDSTIAEIWPSIPFLHETCTIEALAASPKRFELVRWRMDSRDLEELHSVLSSKKQGGPSLSKQDCITAYLVAVFNYTRNNPVKKVRNVTSYRDVRAPFIAENVASNLGMHVVADVSMDSDMAGIATAVRNALVQYRNPDYIHSWVPVTSSLKCEAFNSWKVFPWLAAGSDDELVINSVSVIDFCSAHFGCPDGTRFHMDGTMVNWVRVYRSNPAKGVDGAWQARRSVDISMGVAPGVKPKLLETLALGVRYMLKDGHARL